MIKVYLSLAAAVAIAYFAQPAHASSLKELHAGSVVCQNEASLRGIEESFQLPAGCYTIQVSAFVQVVDAQRFTVGYSNQNVEVSTGPATFFTRRYNVQE